MMRHTLLSILLWPLMAFGNWTGQTVEVPMATICKSVNPLADYISMYEETGDRYRALKRLHIYTKTKQCFDSPAKFTVIRDFRIPVRAYVFHILSFRQDGKIWHLSTIEEREQKAL